MMDFLRKHMRIIFLITIIGFLGGAFIGFGSYFFGEGSLGDTVVEVNSTKIPYRTYTTLVNRTINNLHQQKKDVTDEIMAQVKQEAVQDIVQEEVFWQEARKYGVTVSDGELAADIQRYPAFQNNGAFDRNAYFQVLYQVLRTTPREFEQTRRRQLAIMKLRHLIASSVTVGEPELRSEYARANNGAMANFEKDRAKFLESFRQEKTAMVFNEWFKQLNQSMKVKIYLDRFEPKAS